MKITLVIFSIIFIISAVLLLALIISNAISHSETLNDFDEYLDDICNYEEN